MREIEQKIIDLLDVLKPLGRFDKESYMAQSKIEQAIDKSFDKLRHEHFGASSSDFLHDPRVKLYARTRSPLKYWLLVENYIVNASDESLEKENSVLLEDTLRKTFSKVSDLPARQAFADPVLIRNIYLSGNDKLIELFKQYLPIPKPTIFHGHKLPVFIAEEERKVTKSVLAPLKEKTIIKAQRRFRGKKRQRAEEKRIAQIIETNQTMREDYETSGKESVAQLLKEANTPYHPKQCAPELADKIVEASKKVRLSSTISHLTSAKALSSILDEGLYGRDTLEKFYMSYQGAALKNCDVRDGDHNVICFGPQGIDPKSMQSDTVEITLDLEKIELDNSAIFYKQMDLGYLLNKQREISLGAETLIFSQTNDHRGGDREANASLQLFGPNGGLIAWSEVPKFILIAYDTQNMHQILTLNFFRFLDTLHTSKHGEDKDHDEKLIKSIYDNIAKLDDKALVAFLEDLGRKMTDTAEFNFYGAHRIDFSSIKTIKDREFDHVIYTLSLPHFIEELQTGNLDQLKEAKIRLPQLFKSYRFIDFLVSKIPEGEIKAELLSYRKDCALPFWQDAKENGLTSESSDDALKAHQTKFMELYDARQTTSSAREKQENEERMARIDADYQLIEEREANDLRLAQEKADELRRQQKAAEDTRIQEEQKAERSREQAQLDAEKALADLEIKLADLNRQAREAAEALAERLESKRLEELQIESAKSAAADTTAQHQTQQAPHSPAKRHLFLRSDTERTPVPSKESIKKQIIDKHLTKNALTKTLHAVDLEGLKFLLEKYIARVENYIGKDDSSIDYRANFISFKSKQAANREANYQLAIKLLEKLDALEKPDYDVIRKLFDKESIYRLREGGHSYSIFGGGVRSKELLTIIEDAQKIQPRNKP